MARKIVLDNGKVIPKKRQKIRPLMVFVSIIFGIYALSLVIPLLWGVMTSLQGRVENMTDRTGVPDVLYFSNYSFLYKKDCFDAPKTKRKNPDTNHCWIFQVSSCL